MMNRDEYVEKLKQQVDQWNEQLSRWESMARDAQGRGMKQLDQLAAKRDEAMAEMRRLQHASIDAWAEMMRGTDAAFKSMQEAFDKARKNFEKK